MKTSNLIWSLVLCTSLGAAKPNIVFFLVDDLGYMDVGAYNPDGFYETPHIDIGCLRHEVHPRLCRQSVCSYPLQYSDR